MRREKLEAALWAAYEAADAAYVASLHGWDGEPANWTSRMQQAREMREAVAKALEPIRFGLYLGE